MVNIFTSLLRISLSTEALLLIGIFIVIIFLIYPIKILSKQWIYRISIACATWWLILLIIFPPHGIDYNIYKYNADLTINSQPAFGRLAPYKLSLKDAFKNPRYFDYTGFQHLIYVGLEYIDHITKTRSLKGLGFQLWLFFTFIAVFLIILYRNRINPNKEISQIFWPIIVLSFHPAFSLYWIIYYWEDKAIFILIPLLIIYLIEKRQFSIASLLVGLVILWDGILIFLAPAFLIYLYRVDKKNFVRYLNLFLLGIIIAAIPFFPQSLPNWKNRLWRMNHPNPFWYSIYLLLPSGVYTPQLNRIITILLALMFNLLYFFRRICIVDMLISSVCITITLGPFNYIARFVPILFLIAYLTPQISKKDWLIFSALLGLLLLININTKSDETNFFQTLIFHIPFFYIGALYLIRRTKYPIPVLWRDPIDDKNLVKE